MCPCSSSSSCEGLVEGVPPHAVLLPLVRTPTGLGSSTRSSLGPARPSPSSASRCARCAQHPSQSAVGRPGGWREKQLSPKVKTFGLPCASPGSRSDLPLGPEILWEVKNVMLACPGASGPTASAAELKFPSTLVTACCWGGGCVTLPLIQLCGGNSSNMNFHGLVQCIL